MHPATTLGAVTVLAAAALAVAVTWRFTGRNCPCGACPR